MHYIVIFCMGKTLTFFVCDFLRVIHSNFCMEKIHSKKCMAIFLCVHYIVNFCMGKTLTFFVWYFLYGIFCMGKP